MSPHEVRLLLLRGGFDPVPVNGKAPVLKDWIKVHPTEAELDLWDRSYPFALSTGVLTRRMPTLDIDILDEALVEEIEQMVSAQFDEGEILPRIGRAPKRAIPFRTDEPFAKIVIDFEAPDGSLGQKLEFLSDGQQVVVHGLHPNSHKPYAWPKGSLRYREHLPYIRAGDAQALMEEAAHILEEKGYTRVEAKPRARPNGPANGPTDWSRYAQVEDHDVLAAFAFALLVSGMHDGAVVTFLREKIEALKGNPAIDPERIKRRWKEIPAAVRSARDKIDAEADAAQPSVEMPAAGPPTSLDAVMQVIRRWLELEDEAPVYAVLGAVVANLLPGDPVWLGIIAPGSSGKTEILNTVTRLPYVVEASTLSAPALLSGTPKHQTAGSAKGGLLRQMGAFGMLVLKDFGSVLSMRQEARAESLAALREIYDGRWTRHVGSDGGKTLSWQGKVGLLFAATQIYDEHYVHIGALGDRFLTVRLNPTKGQGLKALLHRGGLAKVMREELSAAVLALFAGLDLTETGETTTAEKSEIAGLAKLALVLRATVLRHRVSREIEDVHRPEGEGRMALTLEGLLTGMTVIGIDRGEAMKIVKRVALDSTIPARLKAFKIIASPQSTHGDGVTTRNVALEVGLPTVTVRRTLEDLAAQGMAVRTRAKGEEGEEKAGGADLWRVHEDWEELSKCL
jgi:hypothetical protein